MHPGLLGLLPVIRPDLPGPGRTPGPGLPNEEPKMTRTIKKLSLSKETVKNLDDPGADRAPESIVSQTTSTRCCTECTRPCSICCH
jgi:hypothetical protein